MTIRVIGTALALLALAGGCTLKLPEILNTDPPAEAVQTEETDANRLLNYYADISELQGDALQKNISARNAYSLTSQLSAIAYNW